MSQRGRVVGRRVGPLIYVDPALVVHDDLDGVIEATREAIR